MVFQRNLYKTTALVSESGYLPKETQTVVFAADAAITITDAVVTAAAPTGDIWPILTPVTFDVTTARKYKIWTAALATIDGFVIGATGHSTGNMYAGASGQLQLKQAADVQGVVMLTGDINYLDIFDPVLKLTVGEILAAAGTVTLALRNAIHASARANGLIVKNLAQVV